MTTQLEVAANMLFPSQGNSAANIKFYSGRNRDVSAERLAAEFVSVETQIRDGGLVASDTIGD